MQKSKKQKQAKTLSNPIPQSYIKSSILIEQLFVHPSELLYILIDNQGYLQLFDLPTMSLIGKSFIRLQQGYQAYKCMFSKQDVGLFYILYRKCTNDNSKGGNTVDRSEYIGESKRNRKQRYNYILNINYLTKKNEIIANTCKLQLNTGDNQQNNMEVLIEKQIQQPNQSNSQNNYLTIQKQRNTFLKQYYNQEGHAIPQRQKDDQMSSKLELVKRMEERQIQEELIKQKQKNAQLKQQEGMKQEQNQQSNRFLNQEKQKDISKDQMKQINNMQVGNKQQIASLKKQNQLNANQQEAQIIQNPMSNRREMGWYKTPKWKPILQISKYTRTPYLEQKQNTSTIPHYQFTILYQTGFDICTEYQKISSVQLENLHIITGANIYGNADSYWAKNQVLEQGDWQYSQTGAQYEDVWIIFSQDQCMLIQLNNLQPQIHSKLEMEISSKYYSSSRKRQQYALGQNTINTQTNMINSNVNYGHMYNSSYSSITNMNKLNKGQLDTCSHNLVLDAQKKLCLVMNATNQIILLSYHQLQLCMVGKIKLDNLLNVPNAGMSVYSYSDMNEFVFNQLNFMTILRFGVNTNTTNKYENKVMVLVGLNNAMLDLQKEKEKQRQKQIDKDNAIFMEDENKPKQTQQKQRMPINLKPTCNVYIYSFELQTQALSLPAASQLYPTMLHMHQNNQQLLTIFKQFPQVLQIWYSEYLQNQLSYLTLENHVEMIDLCRLLEGKNIGKEWVNLGYRFEPLDNNEQYEQLQDEFQLTAEQNGNGNNSIRNKISQLNDWSYCLYSREAILNKKLKRLNIMDF